MFFMLFSRTELTLLIQVLHICMLFMLHITCTPAHINIHGISRLHNLGVGNTTSAVFAPHESVCADLLV